MQTDLFLVAGIVIASLAVLSVLAAFADSRLSRGGLLMLLAGAALVALALTQRPGGYRLAEVPDAFYRVIGRVLN